MAKKSGKTAAGEKPPVIPYEQAVEELEELVERMEGGALSLEDSLAAYKRGAELVVQCRRMLAEVQQQVSVLEDGLLKPFDARTGRDASAAQDDDEDDEHEDDGPAS